MTNRKLFEDAPATSAPPRVAGAGFTAQALAPRALRVWLMLLFALVCIIIGVGGLTRLTDSGLSITQWRPIGGAIPPLNAQDWAHEFALYQQIDEFRMQNSWMSLADFKIIYWWEWGHRQLGRIIGLVWAVGFIWFWLRGQIPVGWGLRLLALGALGGAQGAVGWWMVASGINQGQGVIDVAPYRLASHLGLAFAILGVIVWYVLKLSRSPVDLMSAQRAREDTLTARARLWIVLAFLQILLGALVAGLDAGRGYNDWPLMAGQFFPNTAIYLEPLWRNFFESPGLTQFMHRVMGYFLLIYSIWVLMAARRSAYAGTRRAFGLAFALLVVQIIWGVVTVIYSAPWGIAIMHQLLAVALWAAILRARFLANYPQGRALERPKT